MKARTLAPLSFGLMTLAAGACALVEDFEGYQPRPGENNTCDDPPCPSSGTNSGAGGSPAGSGGSGTGGGPAGSGGGGTGAGGSSTACVAIPCGGSTDPCLPVVLETGIDGTLIGSDPGGFIYRSNKDKGIVRRVPKANCPGSPTEVMAGNFKELVSDGAHMAWIRNDLSSPCVTVELLACELPICKPTSVPVFSMWPEQGTMAGLALGDKQLYFAFANGLVGRAPTDTLLPIGLWNDPGYQPGNTISALQDIQYHAGKVAVTRQNLYAGAMSACSGGTVVLNGGTFSIDGSSGAQDFGFDAPGTSVAGSDQYIYFHFGDNTTLLWRVRKMASASVEQLGPGGELMATLKSSPTIKVHKGWVYFEVNFTSGESGIARLRADELTWSASSVEIVMRAGSDFAVDDDGFFWTECEDMQCTTKRLMGRLLSP